MPSIKITSKRQATIPARVCEELNLRPGDVVDLELAEVARTLQSHQLIRELLDIPGERP